LGAVTNSPGLEEEKINEKNVFSKQENFEVYLTIVFQKIFGNFHIFNPSNRFLTALSSYEAEDHYMNHHQNVKQLSAS